MDSSRKNNRKTLYIDTKLLSTMALIQAGLAKPLTGLMNKETAAEVDRTKKYKGTSFPFSAIFAPAGKRNHEVLLSLKQGKVVDFINNGKIVGHITVEETFEIDIDERLYNIYGTSDRSHTSVKHTAKRLGTISLSGDYSVEYPLIQSYLTRVSEMIKNNNANFVSAMMISADPLTLADERIIRQAISDTDLLIIFLRKPFYSNGLRFDIRYNSLSTFVENFLPKNKVIIVPFENSYMFSGFNELFIDATIAKNFGSNQLIVNKNHLGLGLFYDENKIKTIFDNFENMNIHIKAVDIYVYCDTCATLVSTHTCPHGQHHHVHYHSDAILELLQAGILPPTILVRKEVSSNILAALFPDRFKNIQSLYNSLIPNTGLLEEQTEEEFYLKLQDLYHTSTLN